MFGQRMENRNVEVLRNSPFFSGIENDVLGEISAAFRVEKWKKGTSRLSEDGTKRFHVIASGRLEITRSNPDTGRMVTLWLLGTGDVFDLISLLDGRPHNVVPIAVDDVEILCVRMDTARKWIHEYPELCKNILPYLGEKFRQIENLATDLAVHDTMTRIASLILRHAVPLHQDSTEHCSTVNLIHGMSHEALARMVGSVRVVVNRHLKHWKEKGIIDYKRGNLIIKDLEALARRCKGLPEPNKKHG